MLNEFNDFEALYLQYKPLLYKLAKRYVRQGVELDDVLQMTYIGLHNAAATYSDKHGVKFTIYLCICVKRVIFRELANTGNIIRLPVGISSKLLAYRKAEERLTIELMRRPMPWELARALHVTVKEIYTLQRAYYINNIQSLDAPISEDDSDGTLADIVSGTDYDEMQAGIYESDLRRFLWQIVADALNEEQYELVYNLYGRELTLTAAAKEKGITYSEAQRAQHQAIRKLQRNRNILNIAEDYGIIGSYRHVGLSEYKNTRTSATEAEVLRREIFFDKLQNYIKGGEHIESEQAI